MSTYHKAQVINALMQLIPTGFSNDSVFDYLKRLIYLGCHSSKVYPTLASGVNVVAGAGAWTQGALTQIIPASTITKKYEVTHICVEGMSANDTYQIDLYYGDSDIWCGQVRFTKTVAMEAIVNHDLSSCIIPANSKLTAKVASGSGSNNITFTVQYKEMED